jgi:NTP pyrophosphatase (non-canonical NTP hydrolase)
VTLSDELLAELRRHVGHTLRCKRETTGDVAGYVVETVQLRCEDCGDVILEGVQRLLKRSKSK